ncbi:MAG: sulfotransferase domain-containing protein [Thermoanaerobaculia bacterium]
MNNASFFAFSHPKAGSTLLDSLLTDASDMAGFEVVNLPGKGYENGIDPRFFTRSIDQVLCPNGCAYLGWRFFPGETDFDFSQSRAVYLVRDPRDMMVSLFFSFAQSHVVPAKGQARDHMLAARKATQSAEPAEWAQRKRSYAPYLKQIGEYRHKLVLSRTRIYRYEDVIFRKREWLEDMAGFLELDLPTEELALIADRHDIRPDREDPTAHVRQVKPGNHRRHLTREAIEHLNREFGEILEFYGYSQAVEENPAICFQPERRATPSS